MFINSPNMGLPIPTVGQEPGPNYATDVNSSLTLIDGHNHTPGFGVQITPAGLNINSALTLQGNFITNAAGITFIAQSSIPANFTFYTGGVDAFYVDGLGNNIQITKSGAIAGTSGSIANLTSPASATYVSGSSTFVWQSNVNTAANMDFGSAIMRNLSPNSTNALTLQPPAALAANYSLTLPTLPPGQQIMTLDASGIMSAPYTVDGSTVAISSNVLGVPANGINTTQLANGSVTVPKLAAGVSPGTITNKVVISGAGSTTWAAPANVTQILLDMWGAGGGGGTGPGSGSSPEAGNTGGSSGGHILTPYTVVPGNVYNIVIGAGGANQTPGGATTFDSGAITATGGYAGASTTGNTLSALASPINGGLVQGQGGQGGVSFTTGASGMNSVYATGGSGGAPASPGFGGGGGGAAGFGVGGVGGDAGGSGGGTGGIGAGGGGGGGGAPGNIGGSGGPGQIIIYY